LLKLVFGATYPPAAAVQVCQLSSAGIAASFMSPS
jgi:hypothetical protein